MSSGSFKDLTKAITSSVANLTLPLPDDLVQTIHSYLDKHSTRDEPDSQRLQEELFNIYQTSIIDKPARLAPFLAILRTLKPAIRGSGRLLQWWDKLSEPILNKLAEEKGLAAEAKDTLLDILIYDEDEEDLEDAISTSNSMTDNLLTLWLATSNAAFEDFDEHSRFVEGQIQLILLAYGKKRPQDLLNAINKFFVNKDSRIAILTLLGEFIRHGPPHLHQILSTPLFVNLLRCLQADTSTRVISLAMTCLIMLLPHVPQTSSKHLPALFNIYSRMLFWDRERRKVEPQIDEDDEKSIARVHSEDDDSWAKLSYILESEDDTVPELRQYFTFLYGLYPINFMSYIRKPQKYLRNTNSAGVDDLDIEPMEIRQRSEPFRQAHLLHPNFFEMTMESELTNTHRFSKSEAADVVAQCMALYSPTEDIGGHATISRRPPTKGESNLDVPEQSLLDQDGATPLQSRHASWRDTQTTTVGSIDGFRHSGLHRKLSQTSQSMPSVVDSPTLPPSDHLQDSPTLPPQMLTSPSHNQLHDLLHTQKPARGNLYQSLTNDSVASLALSNNHHDSTIHMEAYLASISQNTIPRSPSLRPANADPNLKVAYLHREIQLLRNDLNFERYLKQQHLSHIGLLRKKQLRDTRVEAETQNLINSNRSLKLKLEETHRKMLQTKSETEKSKNHARKWEMDLTAKLRVLREDQKKGIVERDELKRDLVKAKERTETLKQLVIRSESRELSSRQKFQSVESSLGELERLQGEIDKLTQTLRAYEAGETEAVQAKENEDAALRQVKLLEMELLSRDNALASAKEKFDEELEALRSSDSEKQQNERKFVITDDMLSAALATARTRTIEVQKAHNHLLRRFANLESHYLDLKEMYENGNAEADEEPLLSIGGIQLSPSKGTWNGSKSQHGESDNFGSSPSRLPTTPRLDTNRPFGYTSPDARSPVSGVSASQGFHPFSSQGRGSTEIDGHSLDAAGKVKPQSEVRVYGRGGVQNIGKKEKDKNKEKVKDKEAPKDSQGDGGTKEKKKGVSLRGIRGFG